MAPTTETLEGGGRRIQRISQGFRSIVVITRQPKSLRQPPPVKTTWTPSFLPSFLLSFLLIVSVGVQLEECNYSFFHSTRKGTVHFLGVVTNLTWRAERGGDCSFAGDTTSANGGGGGRGGNRTVGETERGAAAFVFVCVVFWRLCGENKR